MKNIGISQEECKHPPERVFSWFSSDGTFCAGCCDCGKVLAGAANEES